MTMKRYTELTDEELLALTSEQIEELIDVECMLEGVAFLPEEPVPPESISVGPDLTVYIVGGEKFKCKPDAQRVADLMNSLLRFESYYLSGRYDYDGPQGVKPATEPTDTISIREERYWSPELYSKYKTVLAAHKEAVKRYDKARKEYDGIAAERASITAKVNEAISAAFEKKANREEVERLFARYLSLSGGDRKQALSFYLLGQKRHDEEFIREVLEIPKEEQNGADQEVE